MIIQEIVTVNNIQLKHTYSSENNYIKQIETGIIYDQVYDTLKRNYNYIEIDEKIKPMEEIDVPQN